MKGDIHVRTCEQITAIHRKINGHLFASQYRRSATQGFYAYLTAVARGRGGDTTGAEAMFRECVT